MILCKQGLYPCTNHLIFAMVKSRVFFAVRTAFLNIISTSFDFKGLKVINTDIKCKNWAHEWTVIFKMAKRHKSTTVMNRTTVYLHFCSKLSFQQPHKVWKQDFGSACICTAIKLYSNVNMFWSVHTLMVHSWWSSPREQAAVLGNKSPTLTILRSALLQGECNVEIRIGVAWLRAWRPQFDSRHDRIFLFATTPDRLWGTPSLLSNGYRAPFLWDKVTRAWS
jgi:hypothetical protein